MWGKFRYGGLTINYTQIHSHRLFKGQLLQYKHMFSNREIATRIKTEMLKAIASGKPGRFLRRGNTNCVLKNVFGTRQGLKRKELLSHFSRVRLCATP